MSYASLLSSETVTSNFLCILRPRRRVLNFSLVSGSTYKASFTYGDVYTVEADGLELTEAASSTLAVDEWFYDSDTNELYVRLTSGADPDTVYLISTYNIYTGTNDSHWYSDPLDDTSRVVYYDAVISKSPVIKYSTGDLLNGYMPVQSSSVVINNSEHWLDKHLYDSSFSQAQVLLYHWLDDLEVTNLKLVLNGILNNVDMSDQTVTFSLKDRLDIFQSEYRHDVGDQFFTLATFSSLEANAVDTPIRAVFGMVDNFAPTNIDYVPQNETTSDNRDWVVCNGQTGLADVIATVVPGSTTTRTYVNSVSGLNVGDNVWLDRVAGVDEYKAITLVDIPGNYIEHVALVSPMVSSDSVKRAFVGNVFIIQNQILYPAFYGRDYTVASFAGVTSGFSFTTSLEANISLPNTLSAGDTVFCRSYGRSNYLTLGGPAFGADNAKTKNMALPAQGVLDLLKRVLSVEESDIDQGSFTAALSSATYPIGYSVPDRRGSGFPDVKSILVKILNSGLMNLVINEDALWEIVTTEPFGVEDLSIDQDELLDGSVSFSFDADEIYSEVDLEYGFKEVNSDPSRPTEQVSHFVVSSQRAKYVHKIQKTKKIDGLVVYESDADILATRLAHIFSERGGELQFRSKNRMFGAKVGDIILVSRAVMPGYTYDADTLQSRKYKITGLDKGLRQVTIKTLDFKGIEDNSGSW